VRPLVTVALAIMFGLLPGSAAAQGRSRHSSLLKGQLEAGIRAGRDFENHAWSAGALLRLPVQQRLELRPSGDVFFPKEGKKGWQINGDADIPFGPGGTVYAGGGIAFVHLDDDKTRTGYNLFFGLIPSNAQTGWKPFVEFRWTFVHDTSPFRLVGGFTHRIG
jgi:opacity protein-like surface antigen